jgi:hypothetical protein
MKHEYEISYVIPACAYFKCNVCDALIVLDYPETYEASQETYTNLVRQHEHKEE